jgi:PIN domain nuclease of toxin-antitoxin system
MASVVLDASALLAFVAGERGGEAVADAIGDAMISTVNLAEVVAKLVDRGAPLERAREILAIAACEVMDFDRAQAEEAGALIARTRGRGLSLGDRACLALARREGVPALTADRRWAEVDTGVQVTLFR